MAYIYKILNKISKKVYIGITTYKDVKKDGINIYKPQV
jgi:hypothetical protein